MDRQMLADCYYYAGRVAAKNLASRSSAFHNRYAKLVQLSMDLTSDLQHLQKLQRQLFRAANAGLRRWLSLLLLLLAANRQNWRLRRSFKSAAGPCPQLRLVLQVARLCPQTIAAARAPKSIPLYEYLAYLTAFLSTSVPAWANWLLSLVTDAYTFTSHFLLSPHDNWLTHVRWPHWP